MAQQANWRFCQECHAMFFAGYQGGRCPTGGPHLPQGVNFTLLYDVPSGPTAQQGWRFCLRCNALFYERAGGGVCPAGGSHSAQGIDTFALSYNVPSAPGAQGDWHLCVKCGAMFFGGYGGGRCPAGDKHAASVYNFVLPYTMDGYIPGMDRRNWVGFLSGSTQRGTYENIDAASIVGRFQQGQSGTYLLGGSSRGYMRWLELLDSLLVESIGPPPGVNPTKASLPWTTYSERPKLIVIRQGWTFPIPGRNEVRYFILEIWWLAADDTEYQVIAGHARRAEGGPVPEYPTNADQIGYGIVMRPFCGDIALYELMKRELAATVIQGAMSLIVSAAAWKLSTLKVAGSSAPLPLDAEASLNKAPPTRSGIRVLLVGPETESEFQYAQKVNTSGGKATAVNPLKTAAADRFAAGGGEFVQGKIDALPKDAKFDIIREDFPYPTGNFIDTASANERISRLKPGGSWVVVTEKPDFADTLEAAAALQGVKVMRRDIAQWHEGAPASDHPKDSGRIAIIITR